MHLLLVSALCINLPLVASTKYCQTCRLEFIRNLLEVSFFTSPNGQSTKKYSGQPWSFMSCVTKTSSILELQHKKMRLFIYLKGIGQSQLVHCNIVNLHQVVI